MKSHRSRPKARRPHAAAPDAAASDGPKPDAPKPDAPKPEGPAPDAPARFVDDYLLYLMARASHAASAQFHLRLASRGVSAPTWRVLAGLAGAGALAVGELARVVLLKQPTLTKTLDRLEGKGLIAREESAQDRRQVLVRLTPAGEALVGGLLDDARAHERCVLGALGRDGPRFADLLRRLIAALDGA